MAAHGKVKAAVRQPAKMSPSERKEIHRLQFAENGTTIHKNVWTMINTSAKSA